MSTETNRDRLHAHLSRLGWSQRRLADWLTEQGESTSTRTVERWMGGQTRCPAYPSLLIELRQPQDQGRQEQQADTE